MQPRSKHLGIIVLIGVLTFFFNLFSIHPKQPSIYSSLWAQSKDQVDQKEEAKQGTKVDDESKLKVKKEKKNNDLKQAHLAKVRISYEKSKPFIASGDEKGKEALDLFLDKYEGHAMGNPLKEEALAFYEAKKVARENRLKVGIEWVFIRGGSFMMGSYELSRAEKPVHKVKVKDFYMSKTEVTVGQYRKCVEVGVCSLPDDRDSAYKNCNWGHSDREDHPINCVDWKQARAFAEWLGADLPSEAQWEYAARSRGKNMIYPWGNTMPTCDIAHFRVCYEGTIPVCSKTAGNTIQGLCDMGGNVLEWVLDSWHNSYRGAPTNDIAWCENNLCEYHELMRRVFRGGQWPHKKAEFSQLLSAFRYPTASNTRNTYIGFRISDTSILIH